MSTTGHALLAAVLVQLAVAPALASAAPAASTPQNRDPEEAPAPVLPEPGGRAGDAAVDRPFQQRSLALSLDGERLRERGSDGERFGAGGLSLRASTALAGRLRIEERHFSAWGLIGGIEAKGFTADLPEVEGSSQFLRLGLSLTGFYAPSARDAFWLQLGVFTAEQTSLLPSPQILPHGMAMGAHRFGPGLRVLYGFGFTHRFGRGLPLPFAGVDWRFAPRWRLDVLLPARTGFTYAPSDELSFGLALTAGGDRFRYHAVAPTSGAESTQDLRIARVRLGPSAEYSPSRRVHLRLDVGAEGAWVDTGLDSRRALGGYIGMSLRFGGRGLTQDDPGGEP